jgi:hypothetical protein
MSAPDLRLLEAALAEVVETAPATLNWGTDPARYPALITRMAHAIQHWLSAQRKARDRGYQPVLLAPATVRMVEQFRARPDQPNTALDSLGEHLLCRAVLDDYERTANR